MTAMPKPRDLAPSPMAETVIEDFIRDGAHMFPAPLDQAACASLLADIRATRDFGSSLFLSEEAFDADPQYTGVNPKPGRNLLERFEDQLGFVEKAPQIIDGVTALLGGDYEILNKKVVCGVPASSAFLCRINWNVPVSEHSIAVPQSSESPWEACGSPTERSAPATATG